MEEQMSPERMAELAGVPAKKNGQTTIPLSIAETAAFQTYEQQKATIQQQMLQLTQSILETRGINPDTLSGPVNLGPEFKVLNIQTKVPEIRSPE